MKNRIFNEITFSLVLIVLAILFLDPFMLWMSDALAYMLIAGVILVFAIFAGLIWRERPEDERDEYHRMLAGRVGYLFGAGVLVLGIVWQTLFSHPNPWLIAALVGMVLGKLIGLHYARTRR